MQKTFLKQLLEETKKHCIYKFQFNLQFTLKTIYRNQFDIINIIWLDF